MATDASRRIHRLIQTDAWLEPYRDRLAAREQHIDAMMDRVLDGKPIEEFALGYTYYGLHKQENGWILREWAPAATKIYVVGDFSEWRDDDRYAMHKNDSGQWELQLSARELKHGDKYKLHVYWDGGDGFRVPAWATYVVQDDSTKQFDACVWQPPQSYKWNITKTPRHERPLIYEAHIGMAGQDERVSTYREFTDTVLPRIKKAGYNTVQLMAIAEHPYYGSFGYHVSSFFAPSSRFGTPDDLKRLVDMAHDMGLAVIMDLVHSHAVKNEVEGLGRYDGTTTQFFHAGARGEHSQWDSRVFDYGKPEVAHFLLSNSRYWLDEFHIDGFRFDGVTSMLFHHHGLEHVFSSYEDYFAGVDEDAVGYVTMANMLIHKLKPSALTIAEDMSGFPALAAPYSDGGVGFDYRLSMGVPDLWIKYTKDLTDDDWNMSQLYHELTQHRPEERTISYAESHDQALVGDKTLMFRLADKDMYEHMAIDDQNLVIDRAIALHKLIYLLTASLSHGGYLNFMGNEFGHPEWIDFPREGNNWSYAYARRQWNLADDPALKYKYLAAFDQDMMALLAGMSGDQGYVQCHDQNHTISFARGDYVYAFNFHPTESFTDYAVPAPAADYRIVLSSDERKYGGFGRIDTGMTYHAEKETLHLYLPARTAIVLQRVIE